MTIPVSLNTIANLQDTTTAQTNLNANNATITGGFSTALNVTGDQMKGNLDMNSNQILNLPSPATANSPARLVDITGTTSIASVPPVGTSGAVVPLLNAANIWSNTQSFGVISSSTITATTINTSNITSTNLTSTNVTLTGNIIFNSNAPWVDIRAYGALSGVDNSSSIQAAINFLSINYGGGVVLIPNGDWTVSSGITIKSAVVLQGVGRSISVIDGQTGTVPTVSFDSSCAFAGMRDLSVLGQASATSVVPAVSVTTSIPIEIQNCDFKLGSHGMSTRGAEGRFLNTSMYGYSGCLNSIGAANWYTLCGFDSQVGGTSAVVISSISGGAGTENQFTDCDFSGTYTNSVNIADVGTAASLTKFVSCVFGKPIIVSNSKWIALDVCEIGNTSITLSSSGGVITVTNSYGLGGSTVISAASGATKVVSGCFQVS